MIHLIGTAITSNCGSMISRHHLNLFKNCLYLNRNLLRKLFYSIHVRQLVEGNTAAKRFEFRFQWSSIARSHSIFSLNFNASITSAAISMFISLLSSFYASAKCAFFAFLHLFEKMKRCFVSEKSWETFLNIYHEWKIGIFDKCIYEKSFLCIIKTRNCSYRDKDFQQISLILISII